MAKALLSIVSVLVFAVLPICGQPRENSDPALDRSGLLTDRLSEQQLKTWRKIEQIVLAEDAPGKPIHPTLRRLWDTVQRSGHRVYIELRTPGKAERCTAGYVLQEDYDPESTSHALVIRLFPTVIDNASTSRHVRRANGLIPFAGLTKAERYTETLGHELQHAVLILFDEAYARLYREWREEKAAATRCFRLLRAGEDRRKEWEARLVRLQGLEEQLERLPRETETFVWKELTDSRRANSRTAEPDRPLLSARLGHSKPE